MPGFIFGGDTGATYEQVQRRRQIADQLMAQGSAGTPRNVGEGIASFAKSITGALIGRKADRRDDTLRSESEKLWDNSPVAAYLNGSGFGGGSSLAATPSPYSAAPPPVSTAPIPTEGDLLGNDAMAAIGRTPNNPTDAAGRIRTGLTERGLPPHVADAFVMNFQDESGLDAGINEIEPTVPGSRGGFGLAQWTGPRRRELEAFAQERGMPVNDENLQMDFLMQELQGSESRAAQTIMSSRDAPTAAAAIVNDFLRPAEVNRAKREAQYTGGTPTTQGGQGGQPNVSTQQIVELLSNPYIRQDPAKSAVLQSLLQQNLAGPQASFSILSGQEAAQFGLPADGVFQRAPDGRITQVGGGGTNVDITMPGSESNQWGDAPKDTVWLRDQSGEIITEPDPSGRGVRPVSVPIVGGSADTSQSDNVKAGRARTASSVVTTAAERARSAVEKQDMGSTGTSLVGKLPWTDSAEVLRQVEVLKAQAAGGNLQSMRDASPTGGALGNVTEGELALLERLSGALDPNSPTFLRDLDDYERTLLETIHGPDEGQRIFYEGRGNTGAPAAGVPDADGYITRPDGVRYRVVE